MTSSSPPASASSSHQRNSLMSLKSVFIIFAFVTLGLLLRVSGTSSSSAASALDLLPEGNVDVRREADFINPQGHVRNAPLAKEDREEKLKMIRRDVEGFMGDAFDRRVTAYSQSVSGEERSKAPLPPPLVNMDGNAPLVPLLASPAGRKGKEKEAITSTQLLRTERWCDVNTKEEVTERVLALDRLVSASQPSAGGGEGEGKASVFLINEKDLKGNLDTMLREFLSGPISKCYAKARRLLRSQNANANSENRRLFIDMGSRSGDQTTLFLQRFPQGNSFEIHCFEANPAFNKWYQQHRFTRIKSEVVAGGSRRQSEQDNVMRDAGQQTQQQLHFYHNDAVGIQKSSMWLSDRDVGSSIVDGKEADGKGIMASVIDFSHYFIHLWLGSGVSDGGDNVFEVVSAATASSSSSSALFPSRTIIKMDIEKMEYSVLLKLFTSGAMLMVDDLLLECHYTTNKPKDSRPAGSIGKDDCVHFVDQLNRAMNGGIDTSDDAAGNTRPFEAVLWNSLKTAKSSGYIQRHGGFIPT